MPAKSASQERLMQAAAHTNGGYGGVPQSVGQEFVGKDGELDRKAILKAVMDCVTQLMDKCKKNNMPNFKLALDRSSVRSKDVQGFLHVSVANLSKSNICPYLGEEIPDYVELGLDRKKVYQLYRAPEEIEKGAPTCNGLQLMSIHIEVSADEPQKEVIAGAIGDNA